MYVCIYNFDVEHTADLEFAHRGNFADSFGEDFLGLRALGIADEFGLSSLSVPKKLLRGKNKPKAGPEAYVYTLSSCLRPHIYTFFSFQCQAYRTSSSLPSLSLDALQKPWPRAPPSPASPPLLHTPGLRGRSVSVSHAGMRRRASIRYVRSVKSRTSKPDMSLCADDRP